MSANPLDRVLFIPSRHDRFAAERGHGISRLKFRLSSVDTDGRLFLTEQTMLAKGGPPRHLHHEQDEWFYILEGEFIIEVGVQRYTLNPGDSVFAPRKIPHVWANVGSPPGRILIAFTPAGAMEAFFDLTTKANAMPGLDPDLWRAHGMEVVGPPLAIG